MVLATGQHPASLRDDVTSKQVVGILLIPS